MGIVRRLLRPSTFLKKGALSFALKIASAIIAFVFTLVVRRQLGRDSAGEIFLAWSYVIVLATIARIGMDQAMTRLIAGLLVERRFDDVRRSYRTSMAIGLFVSITLAACLWRLSDWVCATF
ncbi:MAG: hypothetical protein AAFP90_20640, partial [Planctomycetota bacterium]